MSDVKEKKRPAIVRVSFNSPVKLGSGGHESSFWALDRHGGSCSQIDIGVAFPCGDVDEVVPWSNIRSLSWRR